MTEKFCVKCGKQIPANTKFCPYCGAKQPNVNKSSVNSSSSNRTSASFSANSASANNIQKSQNASQPKQNFDNPFDQSGKQYVTPKPVSFKQAFLHFWEKYVDFSGYSSRSEFWWWFLIEEIINAVIMLTVFGSLISSLGDIADDDGMFSISGILSSLGVGVIWYLAILIPNLALRTRRFRDAGISQGWTIALLIMDYVPWVVPFMGPFIVFVARIVTIIIECTPSVRQRK